MFIGIGLGINRGGAVGAPSMRIDFVGGDNPATKYGFTFSRASTGTYIGASGLLETAASGVQRRQIDPVTGQAFWLHEQQSTNLQTNSRTSAPTACTGSASQTDPKGTTTATLYTEDGTTTQHFAAVGASVTLTAGTTYTLSVWVKPGAGTRYLQIAARSSAYSGLDEYANLDCDTNTISAAGAGALLSGVEVAGNGWRRLWMQAVADLSGGTEVLVAPVTSGTAIRIPSRAGAGLSVYVWESQIEAGPLTSHIETSGSTVTRAADSLTLTGSAGRTNWIKNSTGVGGTASAVPTGWTSPLTQAGVTASVVGKGTSAEFGDYWDVRFQGTATASGDLRVYFGGPTDIPSANGVQWTLSAALARVAGTVPAGRTFNLVIAQRDSGTAFLTATSADISATAGASLARLSHTTTTSHASVAYLWTYFNCAIQIGDAVDFTLRVAAPQAEKAAGFTGYIPTSGYARTVENIASWWNNDEGTFVWRGRVAGTTSTKYPALVGVGNGSSGSHEHVVYVTASTNVIRSEAKNAGVVTLTSAPAGGVTIGADFVASYAYADNYALAVRSGVAGSVDSSGALPAGIDRIAIGGYQYRGGTAEGSLLIASIEYYPRKLSAAEQQALTV